MLRNIPRSRLLHESEMIYSKEDIISKQLNAAITIQRWYRSLILGPFLNAWLNCNLSLEKASAMPFPKFVKLIQSNTVIRAAAGILSFLKRMIHLHVFVVVHDEVS